MVKFSGRKILNKFFEIGIVLKAVFGIFEMLGGILFSFSKKIITDNFIISLAQSEIAEDLNDKDVIANYLVKAAGNISQDGRVFAVAYLFFHGAVNIFLAISLAKGKIKTYPSIIALLGVFIAYQLYKYFCNKSVSVLFLSIFDIIFACIVYLEYKRKINGKNN